jgi:hypothetical protein
MPVGGARAVKSRHRWPHPPPTERRNADPGSVTGRLEDALGRFGIGIAGFVASAVTMTALGGLAWATGLPWLFPSLAPTALLMSETPHRPQASPRNAIVGHGVAIAVGSAALVVFGLQHSGPITAVGVSADRIAATVLGLGLTTVLLHLIGMAHPPAGASVLVISLGLLHTPFQLGVMSAAVLVTVLLGWGLNLLGGVRTGFAPRPTLSRTVEQKRAEVAVREET